MLNQLADWLENTWHMQCECGIKMADSDSIWLSAGRQSANIDICFGSNYFDIQINNWESIGFSWNNNIPANKDWFCSFEGKILSVGKSHVGKDLTFRNLDITSGNNEGKCYRMSSPFCRKARKSLSFFSDIRKGHVTFAKHERKNSNCQRRWLTTQCWTLYWHISCF